ncbi:AmmeMemoRadiSam system radical SAM enzyme [candidate division LCP-89 bacterium B3_LCP]|uniref:AmmeMemoRadiSam system radical SAM enzyme n=1 Tax=candidate division LCP-89 bacterium B3_LCP TaxID=2012998 RepID=A0A532V078_UNCL8|nr:MAG: AmmeMemoRadiSam system radical SAM enzyme [candidate division LCP-89 bacterium B3_LCP]
MKEVAFYHKEDDNLICDVCPQHCRIEEGQPGICRGRQRYGDKLIAVNYAQAASLAVDPIEKKPLYHFMPGSVILSVGANGCNLQCLFCQNSDISQGKVPTSNLPVAELVNLAKDRGSVGVAFTYSEPLIWYEYVLDASRELHNSGSVSVLVTNGFIEEKPLKQLLPHIDAMNIDLKSIDDDFYKRLCKARLEPVQRTIRQAFEAGVHVEITHLVVTGWNDNADNISRLVSWIASVDPDIPLHLSRYFPRYHFDKPFTSEKFLSEALSTARKELNYVYLGNIAGGDGSHTTCPQCHALVVERLGYATNVQGLDGSKCSECGFLLPFRR